MTLTDYQKELLDGKHGEAREMAMKCLYDIGLYNNAEKFIEILYCHDDSTVYFGEAQVLFAEHLAKIGAEFAVPTSTNACALDMKRWEYQRHEISWMTATRRIEASHLKLGAAACFTCTPYQAGFVPAFGQDIACAESSVIAYYNSVVGARTNRYGGPLELLAGIAGFVPYFGLHIPENRKATGLMILGDDITEDMFNEPSIFNIIAYTFGKKVGDRVWALEQIPKAMTMDQLKQFSATVASSGGIALYHLIGITPEAPTREAIINDIKNVETVTIGLKDLYETEQEFSNMNETGQIDLISLGCPHFSFAEFMEVDKYFGDNKVCAKTEFWVFTSRTTYKVAHDSGLLDRIKAKGIKVFVDGCTMEYPTHNWGTKSIMTNSGKFATYCFNKVGVHPVFGSLEECVKTAIEGKVIKRRKPWWI